MNLIQQHIESNAREVAQLEERLAQITAEQAETRKLLGNIRRYRKSLLKQYPSSQGTLPLALPGDEEEEEATDEADDANALRVSHTVADSDPDEPLVPGEWSPGYEVPEEPDEATADAMARGREPMPAEPEKPRRRRKAAASEEVAGG